MTATAIKQMFRPGRGVLVTNHYITRPDHPCYGSRRERIVRRTSASFWLSSQRIGESRVEWPKASQIEYDGRDTVRLYGGGIGQAPDELFLTLRFEDASAG